MNTNDNSISWMISGGVRADPAELRNRSHLHALRQSDAHLSLTGRIRAFVTGSDPVSATLTDRVCCTA